MDWFLRAFRQYGIFEGRARRREYWMYALFYLLFMAAALTLDNLFGFTNSHYYGPLYFTIAFVLLIPTIAVTIRRLHDVGRSGWSLLALLIPVIGAIWLIVLLLSNSKPGLNCYGINPKGITV